MKALDKLKNKINKLFQALREFQLLYPIVFKVGNKCPVPAHHLRNSGGFRFNKIKKDLENKNQKLIVKHDITSLYFFPSYSWESTSIAEKILLVPCPYESEEQII